MKGDIITGLFADGSDPTEGKLQVQGVRGGTIVRDNGSVPG